MSSVHISTQSRGKITNPYYEYIQLSQAIEQGNLEAVKNFLNQYPNSVDKWINLYETPLLKACACGNLEIVKEILCRMLPEQMLTDKPYHTPLTVVAANGNMEIAEILIAKNPKLLEIPGNFLQIPVVVAVERRQRKMAQYLYIRTPVSVLLDQDGYHGTELFVNAIFYKMLDIALDLFSICRRLAFTEHPQIKWIPIIVLASNPNLFASSCQYLGPLKRFIYSWIQVKLPTLPEASPINKDHNTLLEKLLKGFLKWTGIDEVYQVKVMHLQVKKLLSGISEETLRMGLKERDRTVDEALICAVRFGNVDFLIEMIKNNCELLWSTKTSSSSNLFFLAIEYRQKEVLNFLYGLNQRHLLLSGDHWRGTGLLDLASSIAPTDRLATIAGAAPQMQSELRWFKEIESIAPEIEKDRSSNPFELFSMKHNELRKEAEKSTKDMAGSYSVVAALILTVTFAAVFTVPGGTNGNTGVPFHLKDRRFTIFIVSDIISCLSASVSVIIFLGILTSRYSFEDFLISLPTKMIAGLSLMFISITAMSLAFWSAIFITVNKRSWIDVPVILLTCFPTILFFKLQYALLKDMIVSTYGDGILDRNIRSRS